MKFTITMKDPDGVSESIRDGAQGEESELLLSEDERDEHCDLRRNELEKAIKPWFKWNEYLTVEIDTEAKTCTVVKT